MFHESTHRHRWCRHGATGQVCHALRAPRAKKRTRGTQTLGIIGRLVTSRRREAVGELRPASAAPESHSVFVAPPGGGGRLIGRGGVGRLDEEKLLRISGGRSVSSFPYGSHGQGPRPIFFFKKKKGQPSYRPKLHAWVLLRSYSNDFLKRNCDLLGPISAREKTFFTWKA